MPDHIDEVIDRASQEDKVLLAALLNTSSTETSHLRERLQAQSKSIWKKLAGTDVPYADLLIKVGEKHGFQKRIWESDRDFERRIVRTLFRRTLAQLPTQKRRAYLVALRNSVLQKSSLSAEGIGAVSIVAAKASGFGVYQMATTVMGMASSAAHITIPFIGYMALTKSIFYIIGPLGWAALGASALHKLTKPNYAGLIGVIAWMFQVRTEAYPQGSIGNYSLTELARKLVKIALSVAILLTIAIPVLRTVRSLDQELKIQTSPVQSIAPLPTQSVDHRLLALRRSLHASNSSLTSLMWRPIANDKTNDSTEEAEVVATVLLDRVLKSSTSGDIHLVVLRSDPGGDTDNSCHACSMLISAFTYKVVGDEWLELSSAPRLMSGGEFGKAPRISVISIAPTTYALLVRDFYMAQGEESGEISLFALFPSKITQVLQYSVAEHEADASEQELGDSVRVKTLPAASGFRPIIIEAPPAKATTCVFGARGYDCPSPSDMGTSPQ